MRLSGDADPVAHHGRRIFKVYIFCVTVRKARRRNAKVNFTSVKLGKGCPVMHTLLACCALGDKCLSFMFSRVIQLKDTEIKFHIR